MVKKPYIARADGNRSQTWSVVERTTGRIVQARLLNREEAQWAAQNMNETRMPAERQNDAPS